MKKIILMLLIITAVAFQASALSIINPENKGYNSSNILLEITNPDELDNITYSLDNGPQILACENCTDFETSLVVSESSHLLEAWGIKNRTELYDNITFSYIGPASHPDFELDVIKPVAKTYDSKTILLAFSANTTLDRIRYKIDSNPYKTACSNCSEYNSTVNISEGVHTITVEGRLGSKTKVVAVEIEIDLVNRFSFEIVYPEQKTYNSKNIPIEAVSNSTLERIRYKVDSNPYKTACTSCSRFNTTINLSGGKHIISFEGKLGTVTKVTSVEIKIDLDNRFTLEVTDPKPTTYLSKSVPVEINSNATLDRIRVTVGSYDRSCYNCSRFNDTLSLANGSYTLRAKGWLDSTERQVAVEFKVGNMTRHDDDDDKDDDPEKPTYSEGFEKLPKLLALGEISDHELAEILRNNQLNPGIINRLIKTGKLGDESIQAILDHQKFKAVGIWGKLFVFFGYKGDTYAAQITKLYKLPENLEQKLVMRDDLPKGLAKKIQEKLRKNIKEREGEEKGDNSGDNDSKDGKYIKKSEKKKVFDIGKQLSGKFKNESKRFPPGLAKNDGFRENKKGKIDKGN